MVQKAGESMKNTYIMIAILVVVGVSFLSFKDYYLGYGGPTGAAYFAAAEADFSSATNQIPIDKIKRAPRTVLSQCSTGGGHCTFTSQCPEGEVEEPWGCDSPSEICCKSTCGNGICEDGETCSSDNDACPDTKCFEPACSDGCMEVPVGEDLTDEACNNGQYCDGIGNCVDSCGDGLIRGDEECDGTNLDDKSCTDFPEFDGGDLNCYPSGDTNKCMFDKSDCTALCGNGNVDTGEDCDGVNLNGKSCSDVEGFTGSPLACNPSDDPIDDRCTFDISGCTECDSKPCLATDWIVEGVLNSPPPGNYCSTRTVDGCDSTCGESVYYDSQRHNSFCINPTSCTLFNYVVECKLGTAKTYWEEP